MDYLRSKMNPRKRMMYQLWRFTKTRCYDETFSAYKYYGAKGIRLCDRWLNFENFYDDLKDTYDSRLFLSRKKKDEDFSFENCFFTNRMGIHKNKINNRNFKIGSRTKHASDWARKHDLDPHLVINRLNSGKSILEALDTSIRKKERLLTIDGEKKSVSEWCRFFNVENDLVRARLQSFDKGIGGWNTKTIFTKPKLEGNFAKSQQKLIEHNGITKNIKEWCKELGITHPAVNTRMKRKGISLYDALFLYDKKKLYGINVIIS